jgi:molybdate transport system permease protein
MVHPIQSGLASLPTSLKEASYSLRKTERQTLFGVLLPNIRPSVLTGIILTFAHTIGEFGVVLMIGGNIPGKTRTVSVTIYDEVEAFNYHTANRYALILVISLLPYSYCTCITETGPDKCYTLKFKSAIK